MEATAKDHATETTRAAKKVNTKARAKGATNTAESLRVATTETVMRAEVDDSMTEVLGPALVAGALGRKVGDARTATTIKGITKCRVEIMSTRQKAKRPVLKVPDNSLEADSMERVGMCDERLSLSATDQQVQFELPGDITEGNKEATGLSGIKEMVVEKTAGEAGNTEPRRITLTPVKTTIGETPKRDETVHVTRTIDVPVATIADVRGVSESKAPRMEEAPVVTSTEIRIEARQRETLEAPTMAVEMEGIASDRDGERQRLRHEIDVATALSRRLAEINPELMSAASFLNAVCSRAGDLKKRQVEDLCARGKQSARRSRSYFRRARRRWWEKSSR